MELFLKNPFILQVFFIFNEITLLQNFYIFYTQFSSLTSYIGIVHLMSLSKISISVLWLVSVHVWFRFPSFLHNTSFTSRILSRIPHFVLLLGLCSPLFSVTTLTVLRTTESIVSVFCRVTSSWDFLVFFSWSEWVFFPGRFQRSSVILIRAYGGILSAWFRKNEATHVHLAEIMFASQLFPASLLGLCKEVSVRRQQKLCSCSPQS